MKVTVKNLEENKKTLKNVETIFDTVDDAANDLVNELNQDKALEIILNNGNITCDDIVDKFKMSFGAALKNNIRMVQNNV